MTEENIKNIIIQVNEMRKVLRKARAVGGEVLVAELEKRNMSCEVLKKFWAAVLIAEQQQLPIF